jgi:amino acid adenylation domain-containing protein
LNLSTTNNYSIGYGPSETTNICTVRPYVTTDDMINNIGKSFPNTSTLVLAPCKDYILPRGAIGELCFGGSQVFRGYLKMPELNAEKIIDHPQYGRIYRSGDTGILLPDDSILSTGRIDDQVKIRGQRVELGEITSIALDHPAVLDSATLLLRHNHGAQNIACFWVPSDVSVATFKPLPSAKFYSTIMDIFETLSLRLPSYMVPSHLVPISQIPMTPQSKVDKRLLHSIFESLPLDWLESATFGQDTEDSIEVLSPSEQTIIEVLARTLDIRSADIRRTSSFFNLGVDSISAIRFAKGLRIVGYDQVSVSTILKNSSVKRLSSAIRNQTNQEIPVVGWNLDISNIFSSGWIDQIRSDFKNRGTQVEKVYPCTPLQEAMLSASPSESSSYCNTMVFRVNGQLDNLKKCWEHMIKRHEVLRTAFVATDNPHYAYAQVALAPTEMQWDWIQGSDDATTYFKDVLSNLLERNLPPIRLGIQTCEAFTKVVFSCHHALYDGSAISALLNEIQETYYNNHLPPTIKYELYLQHMINQDFKEADHFWATSFAGFEPTLFPNISNRVPESNSQTHIIEKTLQSSLSDSLAFCQSSKTSLISLVQASWVKLLHFCIGENDLCFGNVVSGRTLMEVDIERLVAPCFNTLPIRLNFDFGRSNSELCKQLHAFNIDSFPFQLTPLRRIQSKVLKDWGRLFDTLVILQQPTTPLDSSIWDLEHDIGEMDLPVVCEVFQDSQIDTLRLNLHYNDSLILEEDARLLAEIFDMALQSLIQHPSSSADDTVGFPSKLLSQSNMDWKNLGPAPSELLHSAFERNATKHPEALALDFMHAGGERTTMSFRVLNESANQVAHALTQRGIKMEDIVPVHMPKSPQFYVSILGILKAGAAFTPIHPDLPEERKRVMLSELSPQVILGLDDTLEWGELTTLLNVNDIADYSGENLTCRNISPTNGAYCLYTSGSTGVPKAVSMEHRAPVQTIESSRTLIPWNANSRLLQYAAITFDMCYYDCFLAWTFGFTLCAADQEVMLNDLTNTINTLNVDLLDLTPSIATSLHRNEVPAVKWLYCIGEAMPTKIIKEWKGACVNSYGPTETAFCTTIFPTNENIKASIIGQPFRSTSFAVFPPHGDRPIPVLGVGELYIGGAQLAREYFKKPELSDDSFVQKCGQRFYKSGDMVRMLSDSTFEFLGRTDDQVKMRGLRVELGEINHVLQECDGTITTVNTQILRKETEAKEQLVSFLVPSLQVNEEKRFEIRKKAKEAALDRLPAYMVPQFFIFVDKIPKSMAGKVDKKALAQIFRDAEELQPRTRGGDTESYTHDWSEIESRIRDTFAKFSNTAIDDITPWTTIYQLGLDSISAVQIASRLRRQNLHSNASDIMKYVNCENLARHLTRTKQVTRAKTETFDLDSFERKHRSEIVQACHIRDGDIQAIRPCTSLQSGMLSQFISNNGDVYFNHLRLRLNPSVDFRRMKNAWLATMQKHQILRTGFAYVKDGKTSFAMIQYRIEAIEIPWDDKTYQASSTVDKWLEKSRQEAARRLHRPPWRVRCIEKDGNWHLDLALLHAIFDAQSLRLIFNDVTNAYNDVSVGGATPLDPILCSILESSLTKNAQDINFWKQLGTVATPTRFPNLASLRHDPLPPAIVNKIASRPLAELYAGCRRSNISLQVAAMSSWATLLATYTGETSATFGVILSGRNADDSTDVVFPCITTVPFVCKISESKEEVLKQTMDLNADIQQHQFTPLHEIQRLMGHSSEPLFDSIFAFQKLSNSDIEHDPWVIVEENATTEYPVSIELEPKGEQLKYRLTFLPHLVPREQAEVILEQLDHLMEEYVFFDDTDDDSYNPGIYSVTPAKEAALHSEARLLHEMVEVTASNYPERVALEFAISLRNGVYSSRNWTYAELNAEGSRIANLLLSYNAHPGDIVGVSFDKCPEASFATLGILKAGCAFVALDPTAPSARKAFIVKDSSAKIVLSMKAQSTNLNENVQATVLNLDEVDIRHFSEETPSLERMIDPQDRSYCLYTSGTTGTPKGCELTHENAVQAMMAFQRLFEGHWDEHSRWLQFASFHFDVSVLEQYWSWSVGICVVSAPRDLIFEDLATSINTLGITHIDLTPSLARILHPDDVPSLCKGVFITGGESLKQEILDVWGPKSVIYNGYGPTEATIGVTMYPRVPANGKPSNIGPQFDNVGSYVLRPGSDMPVLRGGVGELCVSGKLVGKGYLNRPDLTESAFPVLPRFNERVYRTGDLVRILHNGCFEFLGRADDQVKLRGQRLEIGEINTVIKQSGITVADVTTLVLKHPNQQKEQLVAFVVLEANVRGKPEIVLEKTDELAAAKQICEEKLPSYMVPTHFVALTAMPLNVNNKTDARKLKEMYAELSPKDLQMLSSASSFQSKDEKWSKQEEKIRATLNDILDIKNIEFGKDVSFFELGMDSISVIGVSRALKQARFSKAAASVVMKNATVRRLGKVLSDKNGVANDRGSVLAAHQAITAVQHRHRQSVAETLFMDARNIEALAPCTPLQQGMIARSYDSDSGLYFNAFRFSLSNEVSLIQLKKAWGIVLSSTQILRTVFVNTDDGFLQAALREAALRFESVFIDDSDKLDERLEDKRMEWVQRNHPVIKTPFEIILVETTERKILIIHIFHALYDGISIELAFNHVWDAYNGHEIQPGPSFQSALPYGPLRDAEGARVFWEKHLDNTSFKPLPALIDKPDKALIHVSRTFDNLNNLETTRRRLNVTPQAFAQACWVKTLHQYIEGTVTLGMIVSGRSIDFEGADKVNGPLFNTIPFQYLPKQGETWSSLVKSAHDFNVAANPFQHTPLRNIMKWSKRSPSQPLFETLFVYQVANGDETCMKNQFWELVDGETEADYPLAIEVEQRGGDGLKITLVAQGHIADEDKVHEMLEQFEDALRQAMSEPDAGVGINPEDGMSITASTVPQHKNTGQHSLDEAKDFQWTANATILREEIGQLANDDPSNIKEMTSIFELGLDSIDAIKLSSKLKKRGIDLPVSNIMRNLTIVKMTQHISTEDRKPIARPSDMVYQSHKRRLKSYLKRHDLAKDVENIMPLTPLQEAMVAEMIASDYTRYYNHDVLKLAPNVDAEKLQKAFLDVVSQSPILRTSFIQVDDPNIASSFAQVIHRRPHAFAETTKADEEPDFPDIFETMRQKAIHTSKLCPLFYIEIIQAPKQQTYILLSIAHALYDGWSLGLLHQDVDQAYNGQLKTRPSYERTLIEILTTSGPDALAFWRDYLSDATPCLFPRETGFGDEESHTVHRKEQTSRILLRDLTAFAKKVNISLQTLGQTVYALVISSYTQSMDVTFGSVLSGRDDDERAKLLFPTMNTVAIRAILHGTRREMLQYVQDNFSNIKQWQHFPLRKALSLAGVQGALFESLFIYQKSMVSDKAQDKLYESITGQSDVEYPVCVEMEIVNDELVWRCAVKGEIFNEEGAQELLHRLDEVMESIMERPDAETIEFTEEGTVVCGLPAFEKETLQDTTTENGEEQEHDLETINSTTTKTIREVLAFSSKISEEEIAEGMTIFHIGLDSISAIKVSSLLRKRGIILSVGEMLKAGTVEKMARIADERSTDKDTNEDDPKVVIDEALSGIDRAAILRRASIQDKDVEAFLPATAAQVYMLSMWLNSHGALFYPVFAYHVCGSITLESLHAAWMALVKANPILRTCLYATKDTNTPYVQTVLRQTGSEDVFHDVSGWTEETVTMELEKYAIMQPYVHLFASRDSGGWKIRLQIHHALYDGVSLSLLMQQLQDLCNNTDIPQLTSLTFEKYIASSSAPSAQDDRKFFWTKYLRNFEQAQQHLPQPHPAPKSKIEIFSPGLIPDIRRIETYARHHGVSTQAIFLAIVSKLYARLTSAPTNHDIVIGIYLANRSHNITHLAQAPIPTVNLVPLRVSLPLETDVLDIAAQIQYDIQEISNVVHAGVAVWEIDQWTGVKVDCWVNFLKLPGGRGDEDVDSEVLGEGVRIVESGEGRWDKKVLRVIGLETASKVKKEMVCEHVNGSYLVSTPALFAW